MDNRTILGTFGYFRGLGPSYVHKSLCLVDGLEPRAMRISSISVPEGGVLGPVLPTVRQALALNIAPGVRGRAPQSFWASLAGGTFRDERLHLVLSGNKASSQ